MTLKTLEEFLLEGVPPFVFAAPGGLYVRMDGELLRRVRQENDISLGDLASIAGVSRRAVQQYEEGAGATVDVAVRIEKYLRQPVIQPLDPFTRRGEGQPVGSWVEEELGRLRGQERRVADQLGALGFKVVPTQRCPFDALGTRMKDRLITTVEDAQSPVDIPREEVLGTLARIAEARPVIFSGRKERKKRRVPVVSGSSAASRTRTGCWTSSTTDRRSRRWACWAPAAARRR
jgi:putative transcriptional regulator